MNITRSHTAVLLNKARIDVCVGVSNQPELFPGAEYIVLRLVQKNDNFPGSIFFEATFDAGEARNLGNRLIEAYCKLLDICRQPEWQQSLAEADPFPGL